nr:poly(ADP ribose) glycohydrolase [Hymenolepis microstoma]
MRSGFHPRGRQLTLPESFGISAKRVRDDNSISSVTDDIFSNPHFIWKNTDIKLSETPSFSQIINKYTKTDLSKIENGSDSSEYVDAWNASYVKMPCSPHNVYHENGQSVSRWGIIEKALSSPIKTVEDFRKAVLKYNARFTDDWTFEHLEAALQMEPNYAPLLSMIANLSLKLPQLIPQPIPLLQKNQETSLTLNQYQVACLLANAFYCTFPHRNARSKDSEYANYPFINFGTFLSKGFRNTTKTTDHKVLCILHYFHRIFSTDEPPRGVVTYTRRCLNKSVPFDCSNVPIKSIALGVSSTCLIEDASPDTIQVNFANRFLGGGVLRGGCVQEEILCCIRPELLVGLLFFESMENNEALIIEGAERYSRYTGYGNTFKWAGDFNEALDAKNTRDEQGRWKGAIVAIDAMIFDRRKPQFTIEPVRRELNKAYAGFSDDLAPYRPLPKVVVSGNWGCGAFGGNKELKYLIQLMACAHAGKSLAYCTFSDDRFAKRTLEVFEALCSSSCTVGQLWNILITLDVPQLNNRTISIFEIVLEKLSSLNRSLSPPPTSSTMNALNRSLSRAQSFYYSTLKSASVKSWPTIDNPWRDKLDTSKPLTYPSNFVVSKEEFKYVEMLKPQAFVPSSPQGVEITPSGWIPPRPELSSRKPYTIVRSKNHMLPVYVITKKKKRAEQTHGNRTLTVIKKVGGDLSALAAELEVLLKPKCEAGHFLCQVDEATQKIVIDGIFVDEVAKYLLDNGF